MPYIAGLKAKDGYIFSVNNVTDNSRKNGSVVELSNHCGALILTSNGEQLNRFKKVLERCISGEIKRDHDLSDEIINKISSFLDREFKDDASYKTMPLTFLLLVVGSNRRKQGLLEHVYIRNRVTERKEKDGIKEYVTTFDIASAVPADNIFYGESDIIQYLAQQLPCQDFPIDIVKMIALLAIPDYLNKDRLLSPGIEMASLSAEDGFKRVGQEELSALSDKAGKVDSMLVEGLSEFLVQRTC
jgi:hypothetical protein